MIRRIGVAAALAAAACSQPEANRIEMERPALTNREMPAPTPGDVRVRITQEQAGQRIEVGVNQRFAIELSGVPTAGYIWAPAQMPAFVQRAGEASGPTSSNQQQPGFTGGNHWEVTMFVATAAGEGEIVMEQRRPWESTEPPVDVFRVTVVAR
ncbi:MAG: protease inhibitor I42 family protein [Hyphomonadaceae bacterium]|nr:protease inhibitor I42 family protein [Hyphomonadaceae bacterium]